MCATVALPTPPLPARTVAELANAAKLVGLLQDPDILQASRPVLPWTAQQRLAKMDGNAERVRNQGPFEREGEWGGCPFLFHHQRWMRVFIVWLCSFDGEGAIVERFFV